MAEGGKGSYDSDLSEDEKEHAKEVPNVDWYEMVTRHEEALRRARLTGRVEVGPEQPVDLPLEEFDYMMAVISPDQPKTPGVKHKPVIRRECEGYDEAELRYETEFPRLENLRRFREPAYMKKKKATEREKFMKRKEDKFYGEMAKVTESITLDEEDLSHLEPARPALTKWKTGDKRPRRLRWEIEALKPDLPERIKDQLAEKEQDISRVDLDLLKALLEEVKPVFQQGTPLDLFLEPAESPQLYIPRDIHDFSVDLLSNLNEVLVISEKEDEYSIWPLIPKEGEFEILADPVFVTLEEAKQIVHTYTIRPWLKSTDVSFRNFFRGIVEADYEIKDDYLTPDWIFRQEDKFYFFEFTTCSYELSDWNAEKRIVEKLDKYSPSIYSIYTHLKSKIPDSKFFYCVILATPLKVYSNMELAPIAKLLCFRVQQSLKAKTLFESRGIRQSEDKTRAKSILCCKELMKDLDMRPLTSCKPVSYYDHLRAPADNEDIQIATDHVRDSLKLAAEDVKKNVVTSSYKHDCLAILKKFKQDLWAKTPYTTSHLKVVIQVPLFYCKCTNPEISVKPLTIIPSDIVSSLWKQAFDNVIFNPDRFTSHKKSMREIVDSEDEADDIEKKTQRRNFRRVQLHLTPEQRIEVAKVGIEAKRSLGSSDVQQYRKEKKQPIPWSVDTQDIDDFFQNDSELFQVSGQVSSEWGRTIRRLINKARNMSGTTGLALKMQDKILQSYQRSRLYEWLRIISDIGSEIAVSIRQNCREGEFVLKKLKYYNVYLLIKPTNSSSHIFFSILAHHDEFIYYNDSSMFRSFLKCPSGHCYTEFISLNTDKLENWINAESRGLALLAGWADIYELPLLGPFDMTQSESYTSKIDSVSVITNPTMSGVRKDTLFSLIFSLHDKAKCDEAGDLVRYIACEGFRHFLMKREPHKMLEKFPDHCRTRLEVWMYKRMMKTVKMIILRPFSRVKCSDTGEKRFEWRHLFHPYFHYPLSNPRPLICNFYHNYAKNKNERVGPVQECNMMKKLLKYEDVFDINSELLGEKNSTDFKYGFGEFSISLLKVIGTYMGTVLKKRYGASWRAEVSETIYEALWDLDIEETCTIKASSKFTDGVVARNTGRPRVTQAIVSFMERYSIKNTTRIMDLLPYALIEVRKQGCLYVDLFKKEQHGGMREISILTGAERILQLVVETISRTILRFFESDTLVHPMSKKRIPRRHEATLHSIRESSSFMSVTSCSSDDATTWCQSHYGPKLGVIPCMVVDTTLSKLIMSICSAWTLKYISIPDQLMKSILRHKDSNLKGSDLFNKFRECYTGVREEKWMRRETDFVIVRSGMLQGILHFTSSLLHTATQEYSRFLFEKIVRRAYLGQFNSQISIMQGSDDSATITSICFKEKNVENFRNANFLAILMSRFKYRVGLKIGIIPSLKSVKDSHSLLEYNSNFTVMSDTIVPTIKWVIASQIVPESETLYGRQDTQYNLITQLIEGGASTLCASLVQISQAMLHYRLMGGTLSLTFEEVADTWLEHPDITTGFFWIDHPCLAGVVGLKYGMWKISKDPASIMSKKLKTYLLRRFYSSARYNEPDFTFDEILAITGTGILSNSMALRFRNTSRLSQIMRSLNLPKDYRQKANENPEILYIRIQETIPDLDQLKLRLAIKMNSAGMIQSLSKGSSLGRVIASSVYTLESTSWTCSAIISSDKKMSLVHRIYEDIRNSLMMPSLAEAELVQLFPMMEDYINIEKIIENINFSKASPRHTTRRRVQRELFVFDPVVTSEKDLETVVKWKWFGIKAPASKTVLERSWEIWKKKVPWLKDTHKKTLQLSPFRDDAIGLRNFIARTTVKGRMLHLSHAPLASSRGNASRKLFFQQDFWPTVFLGYDEMGETVETTSPLPQVLGHLGQLPVSRDRKVEVATHLLLESPNIDVPETCPSINNAVHNLRLIQDIMKEMYQKRNLNYITNLARKMENWRLGIIGGFTKVQERVGRDPKKGWTGQGIWKGTMGGVGVVVHLDGMQVEKVLVKDFNSFQSVYETFKQWLFEVNLKLRYVDTRSFHLTRGQQLVGHMNLHNVIAGSGKGTPVITESEYDIPTFDMGSDIDWTTSRIVVVHNGIKLKVKVFTGYEYEEVTILSADSKQLLKRIGSLKPTPVMEKMGLPRLIRCLCRVPLTLDQAADINYTPSELKNWLKEFDIPDDDYHVMTNFLSECMRIEIANSGICTGVELLERIIDIRDEELQGSVCGSLKGISEDQKDPDTVTTSKKEILLKKLAKRTPLRRAPPYVRISSLPDLREIEEKSREIVGSDPGDIDIETSISSGSSSPVRSPKVMRPADDSSDDEDLVFFSGFGQQIQEEQEVDLTQILTNEELAIWYEYKGLLDPMLFQITDKMPISQENFEKLIADLGGPTQDINEMIFEEDYLSMIMGKTTDYNKMYSVDLQQYKKDYYPPLFRKVIGEVINLPRGVNILYKLVNNRKLNPKDMDPPVISSVVRVLGVKPEIEEPKTPSVPHALEVEMEGKGFTELIELARRIFQHTPELAVRVYSTAVIRYPEWMFDLTEEDVANMFSHCHKIMEFVGKDVATMLAGKMGLRRPDVLFDLMTGSISVTSFLKSSMKDLQNMTRLPSVLERVYGVIKEEEEEKKSGKAPVPIELVIKKSTIDDAIGELASSEKSAKDWKVVFTKSSRPKGLPAKKKSRPRPRKTKK